MTSTSVHSLFVYPLKGARGIALDRADVGREGIRHDRRFLVTDREGAFLSQRTHPRLALVDTALEHEGERSTLVVSIAGVGVARVGFASGELETRGTPGEVQVWDDRIEAERVRGDIERLLAEHLGTDLSVWFMPKGTIRSVDRRYAAAEDRVGFADGFPILVASNPSLRDLNRRLREAGEAEVPMTRFRPNVVLDGGDLAPYAEDEQARMTIGLLPVRTPKRCARCVVITVDPATGVPGKEPLRTLARYRSAKDAASASGKTKVYFAMNGIPDVADGASIAIAVGDPVTLGG